jgi:hypothetical protein
MQGKLPEIAMDTNSVPVPFPCDRASFYQGPGRNKLCGLIESSTGKPEERVVRRGAFKTWRQVNAKNRDRPPQSV